MHDSAEIDGEVMGRARNCSRENEFAQEFPAFAELSELLVQLRLQLRGGVVDSDLQDAWQETSGRINDVDVVIMLELNMVDTEGRDVLFFNKGAVHAILAIDELDEITEGMSDGPIIADLNILQGLHETTLDVTRFGSLDSSVDETLATSHGVKELLGCKPPQIRILDKAPCLKTEVVLREMRKRTMAEAERYTSPLHTLLPHANRDLGDVDERTLRSGDSTLR